MADKRKDLSEIRPATGVRVKRKVKRKPKPEPEQARVIKNAELPDGNVQPPTEEAARVLSELNEAKVKLVDAMKNFNRLLNDRTLPENKSMQDKENEQKTVNALATAALGIETLSPGEGLLGMCVLAIRQSLSLRDAGNTLAYELHQVKQELAQVKDDIYEEIKDGEK